MYIYISDMTWLLVAMPWHRFITFCAPQNRWPGFFLASPSGSSMTAANKVCIHVDLAGCDQFNNQNLLRDMGVSGNKVYCILQKLIIYIYNGENDDIL